MFKGVKSWYDNRRRIQASKWFKICDDSHSLPMAQFSQTHEEEKILRSHTTQLWGVNCTGIKPERSFEDELPGKINFCSDNPLETWVQQSFPSLLPLIIIIFIIIIIIIIIIILIITRKCRRRLSRPAPPSSCQCSATRGSHRGSQNLCPTENLFLRWW